MNTKLHFVLDLETFDTRPSAAVVSVGIEVFEEADGLHTMTGERFYATLGVDAAMNSGTVSLETLRWWMSEHNTTAREALYKRREAHVAVHDLLEDIAMFFGNTCLKLEGDIAGVWGNGASFDCAILSEQFRRAGMDVPWPFWKERDMRTLSDVVRLIETEDRPAPLRVEPAVAHHAGEDAHAQAKTIVAWLNWLKLVTAPSEGVAATEGA